MEEKTVQKPAGINYDIVNHIGILRVKKKDKIMEDSDVR